jgi:hypothetical protein
MPLKIPSHIASTGFADRRITYPWDLKVGLRLIEFEDTPKQLKKYEAINEADFRSKMGLGIALSEWVVWRLSGLTDVTDELLRIEAAWATIVRPELAPVLDYLLPDEHKLDPVLRPLEHAMLHLGDLARYYADGCIYLAEKVVCLADLARYVAPDRKLFDDWFTRIVSGMVQARPRNAEYNQETEVYDFTHEPLIGRDSFGADFLQDENTVQLLDVFLRSLDPKDNPYL